MEFMEMLNAGGTYGMSFVIIAYFLYKDYKFNENLIEVIDQAKEVLIEVKSFCESVERK